MKNWQPTVSAIVTAAWRSVARVKMKNWQPTVSAIVTAFFGFVLFSPDLFSGMPWLVQIAKYAAAGGLVALGLTSKQYNVTGGTKPQ